MTHNATAPVDAEQSKIAAHAIKKRLDELNTPIKLNHAYEALAIAHRHPNWATMKASLATRQLDAAKSSPKFYFGAPYGSTHTNDVEFVERSIPEALNHIHAFGSFPSRTDLLVSLSRNVIENNSGLIFCQAAANENERNDAMLAIMNSTVNAGRRRDFFVIDVSEIKSKLGNTFNILDYVPSGDQVADLLFELKPPKEYHVNAWVSHSVLSNAVSRQMSERPNDRLTIDALCKTLAEMRDETTYRSADFTWRSQVDESIKVVYFDQLVRDVLAVSEKHPRIFDSGSQWSGIHCALAEKQILVVFLSDNDEIEGMISRIVIGAVIQAIRTAPCARAYPNMVVFNDVTATSFGVIDIAEAVARQVVIAVGDQCPTPPGAFPQATSQFRCFGEKPQDFEHYLAKGDDEVGLYPGWRPK